MRPKILLIATLVIAGAAAAYLLAGKTRPDPAKRQAQLASAAPGSIRRILRLTGQTSARRFHNINAPELRGPESGKTLVLIKLVKSGAAVKKGELIALIDAQSTQDHVDDVADTVKQAQSDIVKRKAEQAIAWENLLQTLRVAKSDSEKARLEAKTASILTPVERELLELNVEETEARYRQLQRNLKWQREAYDAELRILEITRERQQRHHDRHAHDLTRFTIHAPMDGLAVMQSVWRGGDMAQIQEGDQVGPGQLFMKVVDPLSMQVEARANQAESGDLRIAQKVAIRLDAFPGLQFAGGVSSVGALAVGGWQQNYYIRNIPVNIAIDGSDPRLIPDLSAAADILLAQADNVLTVPLNAIVSENGRPAVFVKRGDRFEAREVTLGVRNEQRAAVSSGLSAGDQVRIN